MNTLPPQVDDSMADREDFCKYYPGRLQDFFINDCCWCFWEVDVTRLFVVLQFLGVIVMSSCGSRQKDSDDPNVNGKNMINGEDNRVPVVNSSALPASAIGRLVAKLPQGGFYGCTGTLVAADLALTAGHCVMNEDGSLRSQEIRFFRAVTSAPQTFESG